MHNLPLNIIDLISETLMSLLECTYQSLSSSSQPTPSLLSSETSEDTSTFPRCLSNLYISPLTQKGR